MLGFGNSTSRNLSWEMCRDVWISTLITVTLLIIAKKFKHPKCLVVGSWFNKICYIRAVVYIYPKGQRRMLERHSVYLIRWKKVTKQHIQYCLIFTLKNLYVPRVRIVGVSVSNVALADWIIYNFFISFCLYVASKMLMKMYFVIKFSSL